MSVRLDDQQVIRLEGLCPLDDVDPLLQLLLTHRDASIDWSGCDSVHTAVLQLLAICRRPIIGPPRDSFLARYVEPALRRLQAG